MHILIVDDVYTNRATLQAMLENIGHQVTCATDGIEGIAAFESARPDLVIMDVLMPNMDGYDATRVIKQRCGDRFVPVVFVTALSGTDELVRCIEVGGDDFLTRPFEIELLKAKLVALHRMITFYGNLKSHEAALAQQNRRLALEMRIGQNVLNKIMRQGINNDPCFRHWTLPTGMFSGDLFLAARTPAGGISVLLGDVTGHGLSAAIGAQPVADVFYGMTAKGFSIGDVAGEINRRVHAALHPEIFCAACLVELDPERTSATIWNGAMPDLLLVDTNTREIRRVRSSHHALGVVDEDKFDRRPEILTIGRSERMFLCSDGLIEGKNAENVRYGVDRFVQALRGMTDWSSPIDALRRGYFEFLGSASPVDDVSILEIDCATSSIGADQDAAKANAHNAKPSHWHAQVTLYADSLGLANPAPTITNLIMQIQSPLSHRERIFTIVSELVTNAVDHGLLQLSSHLKAGPQGFSVYFQRRAEALAALRDGWVRVSINHVPDGDRGALTIQVEDSGPGFDAQAVLNRLPQGGAVSRYSGRGIGLVKKLCPDLRFNASGNMAEAVYRWSR
jgi:CheY-like chemotaxis protein/anti-sigma regulatory factor (Ser/Thr protein kinase)